MQQDPAGLSTAELKRALQALNCPAERLAECLERPDYEKLYTNMVNERVTTSSTSTSAAPRPAPAPTPAPAPAPAPARDDVGDWKTWLLFAIGVYFFLNGRSNSSGGEGPRVPVDEAFLSGHVAEVTSMDGFRAALALQRDGTGLPVVVDFYSPSCGPCRMVAPTFTRMAEEYKGRAALLKVAPHPRPHQRPPASPTLAPELTLCRPTNSPPR